jgi:hypothetical protein
MYNLDVDMLKVGQSDVDKLTSRRRIGQSIRRFHGSATTVNRYKLQFNAALRFFGQIPECLIPKCQKMLKFIKLNLTTSWYYVCLPYVQRFA